MIKKLIFIILWFMLSFIYLRLPVARLAQASLGFLSKSPSLLTSFLPPLILAGISAYFFNVFLWALIEQKINKQNIIIFYVLYFLLAFATLLLRGHSGFYGWNFNAINIFSSGQLLSLVTILNLLLFMPVGFLLKLNAKNLLFMAIIIASIEVLQALTHQGYCDIDDWLLNMMSFVMGTQLSKLAKKIIQRNI